MTTTPTAYPLAWPASKERTPARKRTDSRFNRRASIARSRDELFYELRLLRATDITLSTNIELRRDGLPYANRREPDDPGVAVYFRLKDRDHVLACDLYAKVVENLRAITKTVEAQRGITRWGVVDLEESFAGSQTAPTLRTCWFAPTLSRSTRSRRSWRGSPLFKNAPPAALSSPSRLNAAITLRISFAALWMTRRRSRRSEPGNCPRAGSR